jgi:fatty aldehyde-generating acyl-ACP reductase
LGTFGFIIHPINIDDVTRKFPVARFIPEKITERLVSFLPPIKTSAITGVESGYGKAHGWFVACPLTPRLMMELPEREVINKIVAAGKVAAKLGAKIIGLGAFTSVVGDAGISIRNKLDIAVTTGNSYTVATAIEGTEKAADLMGIDMESANIMILGASGSIGKVISLILADRGYSLTLAARNITRLQQVAATIKDATGVVTRVTKNIKQGFKRADVVISVSSAIDFIIEPGDLKPGALVCDVSRPRTVSREVKKVRDDVLIIEGGIVKVPGENFSFNFNFGFPPGLSYACMAETMILALEERYEDWSLGRDLSVSKVLGITKLAKKHGFELAGFRSFEKPITPEEIEAIKISANKKKSAKNLS